MINRFNIALKNENGGPMVQTLVALSVAVTFVIALGGLGAAIISWVAGATKAVSSLK